MFFSLANCSNYVEERQNMIRSLSGSPGGQHNARNKWKQMVAAERLQINTSHLQSHIFSLVEMRAYVGLGVKVTHMFSCKTRQSACATGLSMMKSSQCFLKLAPTVCFFNILGGKNPAYHPASYHADKQYLRNDKSSLLSEA